MNILDQIFECGIVGCGGAGFPTHVKLNTQVEYFIVNAAECEPLLRTDRYTMKHRAYDIIDAVEAIGDQLKARKKVIALKGHYHDEIACLEEAIAAKNSDVELFFLENFYPAGDEQIMVYEVTGRVIPPAGIPSAVNAVVSNVGTVAAISDAMKGIPLTQKIITVTGEVNVPTIVSAPVGTPIQEVIDQGDPIPRRYTVILGGPLMGRRVGMDDISNEYVTKTSSGVIVLDEDSHLSGRRNTTIETMLRLAKSACIQCSFCTELCTRHMLGHPLMPHKIMRKLAYNNDVESILEDNDVKQALICSECGVCEEYACPMGLQPRRINKMLKTIYGQMKIRYERVEQDEWTANEAREGRKVPSKRIAARMGVDQYYDFVINDCVELEPREVCISTRMHIGAPAKPVVSVGDMVKKGTLIASVGRDQMGANIHSSIDGVVTHVDDSRIVIERN
ncbi:MAG: 4Fe-4S dicluster domain-containing protein [Firmicutes bacterium]|nr:4Fe-4S dicluster domain-containing protein [Bacillota bacterium]